VRGSFCLLSQPRVPPLTRLHPGLPAGALTGSMFRSLTRARCPTNSNFADNFGLSEAPTHQFSIRKTLAFITKTRVSSLSADESFIR
ncbi:MAG: hypothetical protein IKW48_04920, partial [Akkermansia sp.]|nr:hypothetical protein [Akkermansia sp.]